MKNIQQKEVIILENCGIEGNECKYRKVERKVRETSPGQEKQELVVVIRQAD